MVPNKRHVALVSPVTQVQPGSGPMENPSKAVGALPVRGLFGPMPPTQSLQIFGAVVQETGIFQCDLADAGKFDQGYEVLVNRRWYEVVGLPSLQQTGHETDHCDVFLKLKDFALPN